MDSPPPKVFMSYARADSPAALRLAQELKAAGTDAWLDQLDIEPGERWDLAVERALGQSRCVLVLLSPASVASANVMDEVSYALDEAKDILPVVIERCKIPLRLRRFQFIDFTAGYDTSLQTLVGTLDDLKREGEGAAANSRVRVDGAASESGWPDASPGARAGGFPHTSAAGSPHRSLFIGSAGLGGLLFFMFYLVFFDSLSERMLIKLSYAWVPLVAFGAAGLTYARGSLKRSAVAAGTALFVLLIFLQGVFPSL